MTKRYPSVFHIHAAQAIIDALQARHDADRDLGAHLRETLILVHPGSMYGSARMHMGRIEADAAREAVLDLVRSHDGPFFVIDGFLSDEMPPRDEELVNAALERASGNGFPAGRLWGCDSGAPPFAGWPGFRTGGGGFIFEGQEAAAADLARSLPDDPVLVTGAWAGTNTNTGCVNSVVNAIRAERGREFRVGIDQTALVMPEEFDMPTP